jgi:glycosyltransferase involved in cell wall biosynthesis
VAAVFPCVEALRFHHACDPCGAQVQSGPGLHLAAQPGGRGALAGLAGDAGDPCRSDRPGRPVADAPLLALVHPQADAGDHPSAAEAVETVAGLRFPDDAVQVAPNGVDLAQYESLPGAAEARRQLGLQEKPTAGFTGHIYPGRGADLLFELALRMPDVHFLWVGGKPDEVDTGASKLAEAGASNVTMTGFVENSRLPLYQAAADVLLMPYGRSISASSGQDIAEVINPMKMFDYMAAGRAILSADLPVIHEVLNESNAVFCEPGM